MPRSPASPAVSRFWSPVPLFRQAIVLANVRAAIAGLPAPPKAEFQRGLLTLTFGQATSEQIAAAVNRAIEVPEVTRLLF